MSQNKDLITGIARLSRLIRRHPVEKNSLSHMNFHILQVVQEHDGIRAAELARLVEVRPASIAEALTRLERDGFVVREKDAVDSRAKRVYITEKARAQFQERARRQQADNQRLLACLTEEEADTFLAICGKLCALLEQEAPDVPPGERRNHKHKHHSKERTYESDFRE